MSNTRIVLAFFLVFVAPYVNADIIRVDWSGAITSSPLTGIIDSGDSISGSFTFDSDSPAINSGSVSATYATNHESTFSVNGIIMQGLDGEITVDNGLLVCPGFSCVSVDQLVVESSSFNGAFVDGYSVESTVLFFGDIGGPLSNNLLPVSDPGFGNGNAFGQIFLGGAGGQINFNIDQDVYSVPTTVPLPGAFFLLASALLGLFSAHRRTSVGRTAS